MARTYKNKKTYKNENKLGKILDMKSAGLVGIGILVWIVLYNTIGVVVELLAHVLGFLITVTLFGVYAFVIDEDNYNKLGGERLYKYIFVKYFSSSKRNIYINTKGEDLWFMEV